MRWTTFTIAQGDTIAKFYRELEDLTRELKAILSVEGHDKPISKLVLVKKFIQRSTMV